MGTKHTKPKKESTSRWNRELQTSSNTITNDCDVAARYGRLDELKRLRAQTPPDGRDSYRRPCESEDSYGHPYPWSKHTCALAAENGHLHVLQWLRSQDSDGPDGKDPYGRPCPWDFWVCVRAAENGHLHILQWARSQDPPCPWGGSCLVAAASGHLHILKWLRSQDLPEDSYRRPCPWGEESCTNAAAYGHLDVLKWLRAQTPPDGKDPYGRPDGKDPYGRPCPWREESCIYAAARNNNVNIIMWILDQHDNSSHITDFKGLIQNPQKCFDDLCLLHQRHPFVFKSDPTPWIQAVTTHTQSLPLPSELIGLIKHYV